MHSVQRSRERDCDTQKFNYFQRFVQQSVERFAARILEYKHRVSIATRERFGPHRPVGIKLTGERVFMFDPRKIRWGLWCRGGR